MTVQTRGEGRVAGDEQSSGPRPSPLAPRPSEPAVVASGASKRFDDHEVVSDLSFEVEQGTIFGIIGPSGSGKTTTMRMLLGVLRPSAGELHVMGRRPHQFRRRDRERLGYMPQLFVLFPELSVMENMNFAASVYGVGWFGRSKRVRAALEFVELWGDRSKPADQLSGGMKRRLELAATLVHDPRVIFLDEPTAGIDPVLRQKFWDHFRELRDAGRTLIVTTQYVTEAEYCDRIVALREGRLVTVGAPEEVRREAIGGEVVIVTGPDLDARARRAIYGVDPDYRVRRLADDRLEVIVDDAGAAVPALIDALRAAEVAVDTVEEQHASFDEVFVRLMEADENGERQ
jgi:ABC-2 type transport system ATP-binding protein